MKKNIILVGVGLCFSALALAGDAPDPGRKVLTPEQKARMNERAELILGGAKIVRPGSQQGTIYFVDTQAAVSNDWITATVGYLSKVTDFSIKIQKGQFELGNTKVVGEASIFIVDSPTMPNILVAPEDRWAVVNVNRLKSDMVAFFEARVKKEFCRAFAMLCGGMSSNFAMSLAGPMLRAEDLDKIPDAKIPLDVVARMPPYMEKLGVKAAEKKTYRKACEEGWAPSPTNDVQRIIWDDYHADPTKPMTIKYDKKAGK